MTIENSGKPDVNFNGHEPDSEGKHTFMVDEYHIGIHFSGPDGTGTPLAVCVEIPLPEPVPIRILWRFKSRRAVEEHIQALVIETEKAWPPTGRSPKPKHPWKKH